MNNLTPEETISQRMELLKSLQPGDILVCIRDNGIRILQTVRSVDENGVVFGFQAQLSHNHAPYSITFGTCNGFDFMAQSRLQVLKAQGGVAA